MNRFPEPYSVLILDNASIHKGQYLRSLCEEKGVILEFLPAYSPDYNPVSQIYYIICYIFIITVI
jgi:transposase